MVRIRIVATTKIAAKKCKAEVIAATRQKILLRIRIKARINLVRIAAITEEEKNVTAMQVRIR